MDGWTERQIDRLHINCICVRVCVWLENIWAVKAFRWWIIRWKPHAEEIMFSLKPSQLAGVRRTVEDKDEQRNSTLYCTTVQVVCRCHMTVAMTTAPRASQGDVNVQLPSALSCSMLGLGLDFQHSALRHQLCLRIIPYRKAFSFNYHFIDVSKCNTDEFISRFVQEHLWIQLHQYM